MIVHALVFHCKLIKLNLSVLATLSFKFQWVICNEINVYVWAIPTLSVYWLYHKLNMQLKNLATPAETDQS